MNICPGGIWIIVQVNDLKNSPGPMKNELGHATNQALSILQDNYPEFVAKQIFINVPWWYLSFNRMIIPLFTLRTKSKFVFAGPSKSAEPSPTMWPLNKCRLNMEVLAKKVNMNSAPLMWLVSSSLNHPPSKLLKSL